MTGRDHRIVQGGLAGFFLLVAVAVVCGYSFGKDMALRDNAAGAAAAR